MNKYARNVFLKFVFCGAASAVVTAALNASAARAAEQTDDPTHHQLLPSREDIARDTAKDMSKDDSEQTAALAATIRAGSVIMRNGQKYRAFHSKAGILLVPLTGNDIRPEDFEASLCTSATETRTYFDPRNKEKIRPDKPDERLVIGAEKPLSKKLTTYAGLMAKVFRQKCGTPGDAPKNPAKVTPEVGLQWDNGSKSGGQDKIFLNPMGAGFGASF